ncbi:MAG TPA: serine/threonine-protein kinase [Pirellulales bacterium]|jgi:serine/threonine protein kinase|nr:serine/threonine-protein kinase [Pirellulales bacterium]
MKTLANNRASDTADLLAKVADEFLKAKDRGQEPNVEEYAERYPEIAPILRDILPALTLMNPSLSHGDSLPPDTENLSSRTLGDFRIEREIGRGGMGVVYQAEQISLGRTVALKVLPFAAMLDPRQLTRFRNEARAAAALHHNNIVPVFSVGCERGVHFYAMQYIEGESLASLIANLRRAEGRPEVEQKAAAGSAPLPLPLGVGRGEGDAIPIAAPSPPTPLPQRGEGRMRSPLTPRPSPLPASTTLPEAQALLSTARSTSGRAYFRNAAELGIQAAEALDYAHEQGVVHRDIKPANLILDETGRLWITDFGLARMENDAGMTMTGDLVGTLRYMSPEQALAKRVVVDHRTDIYSLGVTLYELLTLRPVFDGEDRQHLLKQIAFEEPAALRKVNRQIPVELETIVFKAIRKNPEERYATAHDLAEDLRSFLANKPIKAKPPGRRERLTKWSRRHPALLLSAAVIAAVIAVGSSVALVLINGAKNDAIVAREKSLNAEARANVSEQHAQAALDFLLSTLRNPDPYRDGRTITIAEVLDRSSKKLQDKFADDPLTKAKLLAAIGQSYSGLGLFREAIPVNEQARDLAMAVLGPEDPIVLARMNEVAAAYFESGRYTESLPLFEELVKLSTAKIGPERHCTLEWMGNLALNYQRTGRLDDAIRLMEKTLKIQTAKLGPEHPDTLGSMNNLGNVLNEVGRSDEAIHLFEKLLGIRKAKRLPEDYDSAEAMHNLGNALNAVGRSDEAVPWLDESLKFMRSKFGPDDARTLIVMNTLAICYYQTGRVDNALKLFEEVLKRSEAKLGPVRSDFGRLDYINNLANVYLDVGKFDEAIRMYQELLNITKAKLGAENRLTLGKMSALTDAYLEADRPVEAEPLARECLRSLEKQYPDDWHTFSARTSLGSVLLLQARYTDAEPLLVSGYKGMQDRIAGIRVTERSCLREPLRRLAQFYEATNQPEKAAAWKAKLAEFYKANPTVFKKGIPPTKKADSETDPNPSSPTTSKRGK